VRDCLDQANMFGSDISPEARVILENLNEYRRSSKKIGQFISGWDCVIRIFSGGQRPGGLNPEGRGKVSGGAQNGS
jgi:hypothetical protein